MSDLDLPSYQNVFNTNYGGLQSSSTGMQDLSRMSLYGKSPMDVTPALNDMFDFGDQGGNGIFGNISWDGISEAFSKSAPVFQGMGSMLNAYLGMKQYGLAKKQFSQRKMEYERNYTAQKQLTNAQLEDRQRARVGANPRAYQSVDSYMAKNGIK